MGNRAASAIKALGSGFPSFAPISSSDSSCKRRRRNAPLRQWQVVCCEERHAPWRLRFMVGCSLSRRVIAMQLTSAFRTKTGPKIQAPSAVYQAFYTESDASAVWRQVLDNGWAVVLGPGSSSATGQPVSQTANRGSRRPLGPSQSLSTIDDRNAEPIVGISGKWYVVTRGLKVGVFPNWYVAPAVYVIRRSFLPQDRSVGLCGQR